MKLSAILLAASICLMPSVGAQAKSKKKDKLYQKIRQIK